MSKKSDGANRRAEFLGRLQETGDRHDAAEQVRRAAAGDRAEGSELGQLREVIEELRAAAAETRRVNAEIRQGFKELIKDLRQAAKGP